MEPSTSSNCILLIRVVPQVTQLNEFTTNGIQYDCMHGPVSNLLAVMDPPGACNKK